MINVILADHQPIFRTGTARVLAAEDDIRIVGQPGTCAQMMNAARAFRPHVVVLSRPFLEALPALAKAAREQSFALLMMAEKDDDPAEYSGLGFRGLVYRSVEPAVIVRAVRSLARGASFLHPAHPARHEANDRRLSAGGDTRLSSAELRIIQRVTHGYKNREIALQLNLTEQSVKNALRSVFDKLGVSDRLELALYVLSHKQLSKAVAHSPRPWAWLDSSKIVDRSVYRELAN
jgi:DNA-binding NarL/FixJ family response regulator